MLSAKAIRLNQPPGSPEGIQGLHTLGAAAAGWGEMSSPLPSPLQRSCVSELSKASLKSHVPSGGFFERTMKLLILAHFNTLSYNMHGRLG